MNPIEPTALIRSAPRIATGALLLLALPTEWALAVHVFHIPWHLAWTVPVIVELYILVALELRRDRVPAVSLFLGSLLLSTGVHMAQETGGVLASWVPPAALGVFLAAGVLAAVRLHLMRHRIVEEWEQRDTKVNIDATASAETAEHDPVGWISSPPAVVPAAEPTAPDADGWPPKGAFPKGRAGMEAGRAWAVTFRDRDGRWPSNGEVVAETGWPHDQQARRLLQWCAQQDEAAA